MNCQEARQRIEDRLDGELEARETVLLEAHLAGCDACARLHAEARAVDQWARGLTPASAGADFTERVMARVAVEPAAAPAAPVRIERVVGGVLAVLAASALLGSSLVSDWIAAAPAALGEFLNGIAADLGAMANDAAGLIPALWSSLEKLQSPLNPLWMGLTAVTAAVLMIVFNFIQLRKVEKR